MIEFKEISKSFGNCHANKNISLKIKKGTIHALIGENGAGKSTLCKMLFGMYPPSSGQILINGKPVSISSPLVAKALGIGMVHQHFMLTENMSALDHVLLDQKQQGNWLSQLFWPINRKKIHAELEALANKYKMRVPWHLEVEHLSVGIQQKIEILKLLYNHAEVLILDEPTAVLTPQETDQFFGQLKALRDQGKTVVLITHKLKEVMAIADLVSVFRKGEHIGTYPISDVNEAKLGELMVGQKFEPIVAVRDPSARTTTGLVKLSIRDYSLAQGRRLILDRINLEMRTGEIVGIAGVEGNGQSELISSIIEPMKYRNQRTGFIDYKEDSIMMEDTATIRTMGIGFFPEDRLKDGVLKNFTAKENFLLGQHRRADMQWLGFFQWKEIKAMLETVFEKFGIQPREPNLALRHYSGGNQQKLVVGRETMQNPELLIACQPTRGVDVGAAKIIHQEILDLKKRGTSVLLISSDLDELFKITDRLFVIYDGRFVTQLFHYEYDEKKVGALMGGAAPETFKGGKSL